MAVKTFYLVLHSFKWRKELYEKGTVRELNIHLAKEMGPDRVRPAKAEADPDVKSESMEETYTPNIGEGKEGK